jgi:hypothetical protein
MGLLRIVVCRRCALAKLTRKVSQHPGGYANENCIKFIDQLARQLVSYRITRSSFGSGQVL